MSNAKTIKLKIMEQPTVATVEKWWIKDLLPKYRLTLLAAMGGTGKTSLAAFLASRLAKDQDARIAYWSFEDDPQDFTNKIGYQDGIYFIGEDKHKAIDLNNPDHYKEIANFLKHEKIDILIIDPISGLLSADTNDNQKVRAMLNPLIQMAVENPITILGIHHFRKPGRVASGDPRGNIMGASAWVDTPRHVLSLVKNDKDQRFLEVVKSNICRTGISWEVYMTENVNKAFCVSGIAPTDEGAAKKAMDDPSQERVAPVIKNLREKYAIGQPFNLKDVQKAGNVSSFYNWQKRHFDSWQICKNKKDGCLAYIFVR